MVQGSDCSFNNVTQQGIAHFATDPTHPLDLFLHVMQFYATSFQTDSMSVSASSAAAEAFVFRASRASLQVALEKHQHAKALGPGCLSVLHM
jgi:hypothetical protein